MNQASESLISSLQEAFPAGIREVIDDFHELTVVITPDALHEACFALRDQHGFEQLVDLFGVDFLGHGEAEWETVSASSTGFS
ncbi:MAG TPA: NADH-quinone oxidoreductase subunit C, partial [Gammaproteobacteria bacterium]|nr:NADH-quinone oxidoreductase subunit C [Gammaproteobacteria bacterium]